MNTKGISSSLAKKRLRTENTPGSSSTEPETDEQPAAPTQKIRQSQKKQIAITAAPEHKDEPDSATESESDSEFLPNNFLNPKPGFVRTSSQKLLGPLVLDKDDGVMVPASINTFLREYQREGVQFFWDHWKEGRGGILGDDMGLGKTIQVISFLSAIMLKHGDERDIDRRRLHVSRLQDNRTWKEQKTLPPANEKWPTSLIVAPSTVVHNWEREFQVWGYFDVGMYTGLPEERREVLNDFKLGRLDVVLTSFDTARRDINLLDELPWSCIFVDEAHKVKNPHSKITSAFNQFKCQVRFGLTGTAIQNSYLELWTILDWSNPRSLGSLKQWKGYVMKPLVTGQSSSATPEEKAKGKIVALALRDKILPKVFLRRTKDIIRAQLPTKTDEVVFCPLTPKQIQVYKRILGTEDVENIARKDDICECGSGKRRSKCHHPFIGGHVFQYMSILIKISNHLGLILPSPSDTEDQTRRNRELSEIGFRGEPIPKYGPSMLLPQYCGKWDVLNKLLSEWRKDPTNKVLIFTKSVKLLDMLEYHLNTHNYEFCKLDGSTKQSDRMPMIDKFNNDPEVYIFLISTLAGGTGLNLTGANKVVIFDPNWNPAHDLQAMDRAYRFGQTRDVHVYRLLGAGSIEELIYGRQVYKQQQMKIGYEASNQTRYFSGVQGDSSRQGELFGLKNIFKLHEDTLATKMAIEKANMAEFDWALAHMKGKGSSRKKGAADDDSAAIIEATGKVAKEEADLRGLAALMFDDDVPCVETAEMTSDEIQQILGGGAIKYRHLNDNIIRPSKVEEESWRAEMKERKRKAKRSKRERSESAERQWPPRRRHHKAPVSPNSKLKLRQKVLIKSGMVKTPEELPAFATKFASLAYEEQQKILGDIDQLATGAA
ncbi:hypothetical protein BD410DRAFT_836072 [Rickenella mellea]|uniref:Uncharacterized protein n=1 Tax=Rickenella mellea TaxID=50990 RepID=A0A4Y7QHS4_9AGAM|nr:hypothetical protein BD410DRAFT_836072 [Rickenella mellea]